MRFTFLVLSMCLILAPCQSRAAENKLESWYTYWGLGWANFSYPGQLNTVINQAKNQGLSNVSVALDMLGFYWPKGEQTIIGFVVNGAGDRFEEGGDELQFNSYLVSASMMHFFNNKIGKGPFVRVDLGPSRLNMDTNFAGTFNSEWGFGALVGGGVGIPITSGTRITINANYTIRRVEGENLKILGVTLGGLF